MKKILFAAFAASLLAAGCQKTEVLTPSTGSLITFTTEMKKITKADLGELPDGNANLQTNGFYLWAYADYDLTGNSNNVDRSTKIYDGIEDLHVTYTTTSTWDPGKEYYWPAENRNLMFFAISAKENTTPNVTPIHGIPDTYPSAPTTPTFDGASLTISDFKVSSSDPTNDLMIADFRKQNSSQNSKAVDLNFNHALTKVQFVFSTSMDPNAEGASKVFVQKIEAAGLYDQGTLIVEPAAGNPIKDVDDDAYISSIGLRWPDDKKAQSIQNISFTATWPNPGEGFPSNFEKEGANGQSSVANDNDKKSLLLTTAAQPFATWFMLPQSLADKMVKITYVINERQFSALFPLAGTNNQISAWGVNQYVKYNIILTPDMILFDATIENWDPETGDGPALNN